jgi:ribonucleoside-diphosphate reductase alpha chain
MVPIDTVKVLEDNRGITLTVSKEHRYRGLNWDALREKVKKGMRNSTLMATAPNANIGLVAGTTPGIDPRFAQVFSRNKISGKYLDLNHNLVNDLKNMGIWEKVKEQIIADQGDISMIDEIPQHIRDIYKTSFSTSAYAFIEVAARAQKWMDQSLSRNMYLDTRDINEMMDIYSTAWKKGLKSTYYLHMKPRHTAEQSTVRVNKAEQMGKRGFAAVMEAAAVAPMTAAEPEQTTIAESITVAQAISVNEPIAETAKVIPAVAAFGFAAGTTPEITITTAKATTTTSIEATPAKSASGPFAAVKAAESHAGHVHTTGSTQHATSPTSTTAPSTNAPRIMPPSDPMEQFLCDSCQ